MRADITPGQVSDYRGFDLVIGGDLPAPAALIADKGYDADRIRDRVEPRDDVPTIPMRRGREVRPSVDLALHGLRDRGERCIGRLEHARRLAARLTTRPPPASPATPTPPVGSGLLPARPRPPGSLVTRAISTRPGARPRHSIGPAAWRAVTAMAGAADEEEAPTSFAEGGPRWLGVDHRDRRGVVDVDGVDDPRRPSGSTAAAPASQARRPASPSTRSVP